MVRLREARERSKGRERVQFGRVEKEVWVEARAFAWAVKYLAAAAASTAVGSRGLVGEVERLRTTRRSIGVLSDSDPESSEDMPSETFARAANPVGAVENANKRWSG